MNFCFLLTAEPRILTEMPVQEVHRGQTAQITCQYDRGSPNASITWKRWNETGTSYVTISVDYDPRFRVTYPDHGNSSVLEIQNVQATDEGTYQCYLANDYGEDFQNIDVNFKGKIVLTSRMMADLYFIHVEFWHCIALIHCTICRCMPYTIDFS